MPKPQQLVAVAFSWVVLLGVATAPAELKPGDLLDQSTWQQAEGLLPPEILNHYKQSEYINKIADWPQERYNWPPDFKAATDGNAGRFKTGPRGDIQNVSDGAQPPFIMGYPFPKIDPSDPAAGVKIVWNQFYRHWYFGSLIAESQVNWIGLGGLERRSDQDVRFQFYDGVPDDQRQPNPQNFLVQQLTNTLYPADLNGTASLTWRYRDPDKRDSTWAYVPALRRIRATSPANRSDGFLGSDMSQDDGHFFDGKPEDFDWKLIGEKDQFRLADELNLAGKANSVWVPERKGWDTTWPDTKFIGYMDPEWKGAGWAPRGPAVLTKRRFYVVEGVPRDKYYLYGKLELWIDSYNYQGAWNRKFDWKGQPLNTLQILSWNPLPFTRPDGKVDYNQGSNMSFQCAENLKLQRATVAGIKISPTSVFLGRVVMDPQTFDMSALSSKGK